MDCHSEFTCSDRTKRRRIKATVEKHVRAIAMDMKSKSGKDDSVAEVSGDCSRFLPPPSDLVNVPVATNCQECSPTSYYSFYRPRKGGSLSEAVCTGSRSAVSLHKHAHAVRAGASTN